MLAIVAKYVGIRLPPVVVLALQFYFFPERTFGVVLVNALATLVAVPQILPMFPKKWPGWIGLLGYYVFVIISGGPVCVSRSVCLSQN